MSIFEYICKAAGEGAVLLNVEVIEGGCALSEIQADETLKVDIQKRSTSRWLDTQLTGLWIVVEVIVEARNTETYNVGCFLSLMELKGKVVSCEVGTGVQNDSLVQGVVWNIKEEGYIWRLEGKERLGRERGRANALEKGLITN